MIDKNTDNRTTSEEHCIIEVWTQQILFLKKSLCFILRLV